MRTALLTILAPLVLLLLPLTLTGCISSEPAATGPDATVEELRAENERLRSELEKARQQNETSRRGETVQILSTDVYFKSGSADLTAEGVNKLKDVASRIKGEFSERVIRIEGHTDNQPIGDNLEEKYPSNWELSAARSAAVVRHLQWTHDVNPTRFEVVAYGPYQPVAPNTTAEGRSKNRRVRVAVLPESAGPTAGPTSAEEKSRW